MDTFLEFINRSFKDSQDADVIEGIWYKFSPPKGKSRKIKIEKIEKDFIVYSNKDGEKYKVYLPLFKSTFKNFITP